MVIQLQPPFSLKWNKGYLQIHPSGRKYICLFNSNSDRTIISYARYLYGVKLGYEVPAEYEVDHRDNDRTNDDINNLQLLTQEENRLKQEWWVTLMVVQWHIIPCDYCKELFYITQREINNKIAQNVTSLCCSKKCSNALASIKQHNIDIELIKQLRTEGLSSYKISEKTGYSRNTVMKYWE